jgi:AraC family transcriptional regulator of adaptative response/methylated-DNA-[protein]-cysteine methyltransferase
MVGMTPRAYAEAHRFRALRDGLATGSDVTSAIADAGFASPSRVYEHKGAALAPPAPSLPGRAGNPLCNGANRVGGFWLAQLARCLRHRLVIRARRWARSANAIRGRATSRHRCGSCGPCHESSRYLDHPAGTALPLDVRGTAFQHRVWQELRSIAPGARTTYGEVAAAIGAPKAVRAVARAIATNPVALAIPCHRVVAKGGTLAGYRWGVSRKAALLDREAHAVGRADPSGSLPAASARGR